MLSAMSEEKKAIWAVSRTFNGEIVFNLKGAYNTSYSVKRTNDTGERGTADITRQKGTISADGVIKLNISENEMVYIELT